MMQHGSPRLKPFPAISLNALQNKMLYSNIGVQEHSLHGLPAGRGAIGKMRPWNDEGMPSGQ
jgi:hypothetical protein